MNVTNTPQALGSAIRYGSPTPLNDALPFLAQRACDSTPSVRLCLADVVGHWLLELPDRWGHWVVVMFIARVFVMELHPCIYMATDNVSDHC